MGSGILWLNVWDFVWLIISCMWNLLDKLFESSTSHVGFLFLCIKLPYPSRPMSSFGATRAPETLLFPEPIELQGSHKSQTPTATCASQTPRDLKVALHQGILFVRVAELWKTKSCHQRLENLVKSNLRTDMAIDRSHHFSDSRRVPLTNRVPPWCL